MLDLDPERRSKALRSGALQAFALVEPQRALQAAEGISGELGSMIRRAALLSLARNDPLAALSAAEALTGSERDQMLSAIATSYGRTDPDAALAWAQSLSPPSPNIVANVLAGLARVDPDRAIDLLFETMEATNQRGSGPFMALVATGGLDAEHTAKLADRLLATPSRGPALQMLTQMWAQRQPHDAVRWLLANGSAAPRTALGQAAMQLARSDPAAAIAYLNTVPPELRATWISAVADGYSQNDARAAASWIAQHRGQPGHDAAVAAIAGQNCGSRSLGGSAAVRLHQRCRLRPTRRKHRKGSPPLGRGKTTARPRAGQPRSPTTAHARRPSAPSRGNGPRGMRPARAVGRSGCRRARHATRH